ncbi:hypothetical protein FHR84_000093 [Actinopolyspora biskrensis]|uniref:Secreted protein n=1 Tax=Actinopolyspora biskrensis TaxID=1470178 RepID=A0A852YT84_9ACTN|nr:hypothetical protein [Actinopolyspora biskrensis]NYH76779.1 hypothetical protein [Actinopolyspora biskrensis]
MRRLKTLLGAGMVLFALTACAEEQPDVGFGGQPPSAAEDDRSGEEQSTDGNIKPVPKEKRTRVPAEQVDASQLPDGYPKEVWTQREGAVLVATGQEGGCGSVHARVTEQTPERIGLELVEETPKDAGPCTMDLRYPPVTAPLDEELGSRQVVLTQRETTVSGG